MQKIFISLEEDIINEMFNTENEKRNIATGSDDDRISDQDLVIKKNQK